MAGAAIVADGLGKRFGPVLALDGVDLRPPAGGVLVLLGPDGAGKTTTAQILTTLLKTDTDRACVAGFDIAEHPQAVQRLTGISGQRTAVDPFLAGRQNATAWLLSRLAATILTAITCYRHAASI